MRGRFLALLVLSVGFDLAACVGDDPTPSANPGTDAGDVAEGGTPPTPPGTPPPSGGDAAPDAPPSKPCDPTAPFTISAPVTELNGTIGTAVDADARLSSDQLTIYWSTNRENPVAAATKIYTATRSSAAGTFGTPQAVAPSFSSGNATFNGPSLGGDPATLFYGVEGKSGSNPYYLIATSTKTGGNWSTGVKVDPAQAPSGLQSALAEPYLTPNGLTLVYHGDAVLVGSPGNSHYVILELDRDSTANPFTNPNKTIDEIESDYDQTYPILSKDRRAIYFATNRISADAGDAPATYDVWVATRTDPTAPFGTPVPVQGGNVNDPASIDQPTWISDDQCTLYFNADRYIGGVKAKRIYKATRTPPP